MDAITNSNAELLEAVEHLGAYMAGDRWHYYAAETRETWAVTEGDLRRLGRALLTETPAAYSLWCGTCGELVCEGHEQ